MHSLAPLEELLTELTGVQLSRGGLQSSLAAFARERTTELGLGSLQDYIAQVASPGSDERRRLLDVISVPHTWFFRDSEQLDIVVDLLAGLRPAKIWVPACATGEDAYGLALLCNRQGLETRITASDISPKSLAAAKKAVYGAFSVREVPPEYQRFLIREGRQVRLSDELRQKVNFVEHNLMDPPLQTPGGWDLILCRNVSIYFDQGTALACASRLTRALSETGWIFFGAGEMAYGSPPGLEPRMCKSRVGFVRQGRFATSHHLSARASPVTLPLEMAASRENRSTPSALGPSARRPDSLAPQEFRKLVRAGEEASEQDQLFHATAISDTAEDILRMAAEAPLDANLRMISSIALYSAGDFAGALREARAALLLERHLWPAALYQGLSLEKLGEEKKAHAEFMYASRLLDEPEARTLVLPTPLDGLASDLRLMVRAKLARSAG